MEIKNFVKDNNLENALIPLTFYQLKYQKYEKKNIPYISRIGKSTFYQTEEFECTPFYKPISII